MIRARPRRQSSHESQWERRLEVQRDRRRSQRYVFLLMMLVPLMLFALIELGRAMLAAQDMRLFLATLDERPPAEVKQELSRFAGMLTDRNPFVRNSAMAALKVATGWNLGRDPDEWRQWWIKHEPFWEYRHTEPATSQPPAPDWRSMLPVDPTSAPPAEAP